jgi:hypothetical protein
MKTRHFAIAVGLGLLTIGCGSADLMSPEKPVVNAELLRGFNDRVTGSSFALMAGRKALHLGDSIEKAMMVFPRPSRGLPNEELPAGFPESYKVRGWETPSEGFGVIVFADQIELMMRQFASISDEESKSVLREVQEINERATLLHTVLEKYELWTSDDGSDRLVISRTPLGKEKYQMTITIGHRVLVNQLGIGKLPEPSGGKVAK